MDDAPVYLQWEKNTRSPNPPPPPRSCDSQFHIYGDIARYPAKEGALYDPPKATFDDMMGVLAKMRFERGVIVHPMPYDTDHRLLIDTLEAIPNNDHIRAVGIIKDHVTDSELDRLNKLGVRAARFNIGKYYNERRSPESLIRSLERAREIGWHARLHVAGPDIIEYSDILASVRDMTFVVDHMGHVDFSAGLQAPTCQWLLDRLRHHGWWMMLSNGARLSRMTDDWDDAVPFGQAFVEAAPDRMIWGSDWPHVRWRKSRMPNDGELVELMYRYVDHDADLIQKILVDNPARLHGFAP
ncbi:MULTISPECIES: amidohydrolase family protein [unclassified Beijerinckia]|uniref:amidohydrolase family protein n=1 Tax=unclassified Beijerinckia TaxID=2638183 RepID=UPI000894BEE7|nr:MULTISPECIES: amidohydrolase family protein [unclassified Beijerinckia]MDH7798159.1 2-pyrone-4,6-dicarboxylate lactonase [Beijerinckia sp. GAS462]SED11134.1 Predicted metal-dependent hydrolase, TIM-barrel fold [Beijerinckia sp. 28-YEA-48]